MKHIVGFLLFFFSGISLLAVDFPIIPSPPSREINNLEENLVLAAENGQFERVEELLKQGAAIDAVSIERRMTALMAAAYKNHIQIGVYLIAQGANVNQAVEWELNIQHQKTMALHFATTAEFAGLLLKHGALIEQKEWYGKTPLLKAIVKDNYELSKFLIDAGANLYADAEGNFCLHLAQSTKMIELLLERGFPIDKVSTGTFSNGTALQKKAREKNLELVRFLDEKGADIFAKDSSTNSALHLIFTSPWRPTFCHEGPMLMRQTMMVKHLFI